MPLTKLSDDELEARAAAFEAEIADLETQAAELKVSRKAANDGLTEIRAEQEARRRAGLTDIPPTQIIGT